MKILFLTQVLPFPLDAGPKVRAYYVIRYLKDLGHEVSLLSFVRQTDEASAVNHLRTICREVRTVGIRRSVWRDIAFLSKGLIGKTPFLIARDWTNDMASALKDTLEETGPYDFIHADQLWMAQYAMAAREASRQSNTRLVLDNHNAVFQIPRRLARSEQNPLKRVLLNLEARKMMTYEAGTCQRFDHVVWVSREDQKALWDSAQRSNGTKEKVIPICVDPRGRELSGTKPNSRRITFLGGLHWPPNSQGVHWFVREVWPEVLSRIPDVTLTLVGKDCPTALNGKAAGNERVQATGYVEDLTPYLQETAVFIVPLLAGGGVRVKILDAWSWGLPVVTTSIGAEGLEAQHGRNVLLADSPGTFAESIVEIVTKPDLARHLIRNGHQTIEDHYDWSHVYSAWEEIYPCASYS